MNSQNNWKRFKHYSLVYLWAAEASKKEKQWDSSSVTDNSYIQSFHLIEMQKTVLNHSVHIWGTWYSVKKIAYVTAKYLKRKKKRKTIKKKERKKEVVSMLMNSVCKSGKQIESLRSGQMVERIILGKAVRIL